MQASPNYPIDFQPHYAGEDPRSMHTDKRKSRLAPSHFMLICGCLMLILTVIVPCWESKRLMADPTFVYFVGREYCLWTVLACLIAILTYSLMIVLLFGCARSEAKTQHSVFGIATTVITMLGLTMLLISQPLRYDSKAAYEELFFHCSDGPRTKKITEYAAVLQSLRSQPDCAKLESVEKCDGYHESQPYTGFLKELEATYMCTGFCYGTGSLVDAVNPIVNGSQQAPVSSNAVVAPPAAANTTDKKRDAGLMQLTGGLNAGSQGLVATLQQFAHQNSVSHLQQMPSGPSLLSVGASPVANSATTQVYPPTLFTGANYKASCDGMAARALRYKAMESANFFYFEGIALVFSAIAVMFLQVAGMCSSLNHVWIGKPRGHRAPPAAPRHHGFAAMG